MADVHHILAVLWYLIAALILLIYVLVDGFDLGVGVLAAGTGAGDRAAMITRLEPVWDANEAWLILLAVIAFMVFPGPSGAALSDFYVPLLTMIAGLVIRCRSIAIRRRTDGRRTGMRAFGVGSVLAVVGQGLALGVILGDNTGAGGQPWFVPVSLVAVGVVACAYGTLGATYLIRRGGPFDARRARLVTALFLIAALALIVVVPHIRAGFAAKWANPAGRSVAVLVGAAAATGFFMIFYTLHRGRRRAPFCWSLVTVAALFCGLVLSLYPYVVPDTVTAYQAAAPNTVLVYALATIGIVIPVVLFFNGYQHLTTHQRRDPTGGGH